MDSSRLPESMRRHLDREAAEAPIERVKSFLLCTFAHAVDLSEVEADLRSLAATNTHSIHRNLLRWRAS